MWVGFSLLYMICLSDMVISLESVPLDMLAHIGTPLGSVVFMPLRYPSMLVSVNIWMILGLTCDLDVFGGQGWGL